MNVIYLKLIGSMVSSFTPWNRMNFLGGEYEYSVSLQVNWLIHFQVLHSEDRLHMHLYCLLFTFVFVCMYVGGLGGLWASVEDLQKKLRAAFIRYMIPAGFLTFKHFLLCIFLCSNFLFASSHKEAFVSKMSL
jgi:hypothetical protein